MKHVFWFTLKQHVKLKSFIVSTVVVALACLILPFSIISFIALAEKEENESANEIKTVYVADLTDGPACNLSLLPENESFNGINYIQSATVEEAVKSAENQSDAIVISITENEASFEIVSLIPDNSSITYENAQNFTVYLSDNWSAVISNKLGLPNDILSTRPTVSTADPQDEDENENEAAKTILSFVLMFVIIMLLYFMIIFYGQGVAASVVSEKSSKLSEALLVSTTPQNIIFGKIFSIALAGILQMLLWCVTLILSFIVGALAAKVICPGTTMLAVTLLDNLGELFELFTAGEIIFTILNVVLGFIMYCSLAAISGALASKSEDLSSTNSIFVIVLLVSFFITLSRIMPGEAVPVWISILPFTGMLINPGLLISGKLSFALSLLSLGVTLIFALLILLLASKLYKTLIFYKGVPLSPKKLIAVLKSEGRQIKNR